MFLFGVVASAKAIAGAVGWDLSTITSLIDNAQDSAIGALGAQWRPDGTNWYATNNTAQGVARYTCSTPWDLNTSSTYNDVVYLNAQCTNLQDVFFNSTGTKMYAICHGTHYVYQYTLSTAWQPSSASYDSVSFALSGVNLGIHFSPDGTKMFDTAVSTVRSYSLSTAWDLSTASAITSFSTASYESGVRDLTFNPGGTEMYTIGQTGFVDRYTLSTAWDLTTASYTNEQYYHPLGLLGANSRDISFNPGGTVVYILNNGSLHQIPLATAWDITTETITNNSIILTSLTTSAMGNFIKPDGTKIYYADNNDGYIKQFSLTTAWDIESITSDSKSFLTTSQFTGLVDVHFNPDGTKMYANGGNGAYQYTLSTAWDVSTASYASKSYTESNSVTGFFIKDDGTKMYWVDAVTDAVRQYTLSTAWDVSTASYDSKQFVVSSQEIYANTLQFNSDGTSFYIIGDQNDTVYQYDMSTAWDVSSASYSVSYDAGNDGAVYSRSLNFKTDGTVMYVTSGNVTRQYFL